jgi:hypothetical protein
MQLPRRNGVTDVESYFPSSVCSMSPWCAPSVLGTASMLQSRKLMAQTPETPKKNPRAPTLYCPTCAREVNDPLTCGDCSAVICRVCGTPLEVAEDLGIG